MISFLGITNFGLVATNHMKHIFLMFMLKLYKPYR